jgi:hypothetical protein
MAQSKKDLVKKIRRECRQLNPRIHRKATQIRSHDLLDDFGMIWGDASEMLREIQRVHPGTLERSYGLSPVTYQQVTQLHERLQAFTQRVFSSR